MAEVADKLVTAASLKAGLDTKLDYSRFRSELSGLKVYLHTTTINIPAGTTESPVEVLVDYSQAIPTEVSSPWSILAWILHNGIYYSLPYFDSAGVARTWIYGSENNKIKIYNTASAWNNAKFYFVLLTA